MITIISTLLIYSTAPLTFPGSYVTWPTMEPDKCASAWLIKRFIDREAIFIFIPQGEFVTDGIPFDTPESTFRRYHNMSTFESILEKLKISDPILLHIGQMLHEIEIAYWQDSKLKKTKELRQNMVEIIKTSLDPHECFRQSFEFLDRFYRELSEINGTKKTIENNW